MSCLFGGIIFHQNIIFRYNLSAHCIYAHFFYWFRKECIWEFGCVEEIPQSAKLGSQGMQNSILNNRFLLITYSQNKIWMSYLSHSFCDRLSWCIGTGRMDMPCSRCYLYMFLVIQLFWSVALVREWDFEVTECPTLVPSICIWELVSPLCVYVRLYCMPGFELWHLTYLIALNLHQNPAR